MRNQVIKKLVVWLIGLGVFASLAGVMIGWPWYGQASLWALIVAGFVGINWHKPLAARRGLTVGSEIQIGASMHAVKKLKRARRKRKMARFLRKATRALVPYLVLAGCLGGTLLAVESGVIWLMTAGLIGTLASSIYILFTTRPTPERLTNKHLAATAKNAQPGGFGGIGSDVGGGHSM